VLLPFQPREYADELSLFGSVGTGMTNARCSRGGPLVVLGLGPTSHTGKRWSSYNASTNRYTFLAATAKAWAGTCRDLVAMCRDGTTHRARFTFTK
jgi:hypothetical protein